MRSTMSDERLAELEALAAPPGSPIAVAIAKEYVARRLSAERARQREAVAAIHAARDDEAERQERERRDAERAAYHDRVRALYSSVKPGNRW